METSTVLSAAAVLLFTITSWLLSQMWAEFQRMREQVEQLHTRIAVLEAQHSPPPSGHTLRTP